MVDGEGVARLFFRWKKKCMRACATKHKGDVSNAGEEGNLTSKWMKNNIHAKQKLGSNAIQDNYYLQM
jgi:hypothetical protein